MTTESKFRQLLRKRIVVKKRRPAKGDNPDVPEGNDYGFNMIELVVAMAIIAALFGIGFAIYSNVIGDARGTALNANISTAAETLELESSFTPGILTNDATLINKMTERTNFQWVGGTAALWLSAETDTPDTVRFQRIETMGTPTPAGTAPATGTVPEVAWLPSDGQAIRIHLRNTEGEWRCALLVFRVDVNRVDGDTTAVAAVGTTAGDRDRLDAVEMLGTWYDGGNTQAGQGVLDCTPTGANRPTSGTAWNPTGSTTAIGTLHRTAAALDGLN